MERETIYIQGDRATAAVESPRLITSGGSEAGIETSITITSGGSHSGHVVDSRGPMQELIPLGRSIAANSDDFARAGELQVGWSVVGERRGGRSERVRSSGSTIPVAARGLGTRLPLQQGMHQTSKAPNAYENRRVSHQSQQHLDLFQRSIAGLQNRRTSKGPMKLVIIADGRCLCGSKSSLGVPGKQVLEQW